MHDAVSLYGATDYRWLYQLEVIALGTAAALLIPGLSDARVARGGLIALSLFAGSRMLIAAFPVERRDDRITRRVVVHLVLAMVTFVSIAMAAWILTDSLAGRTVWRGIGSLLQVVRWLVVLSATATLLSNGLSPTRRAFGLIERAWYVSSIGWLAMVALVLAFR